MSRIADCYEHIQIQPSCFYYPPGGSKLQFNTPFSKTCIDNVPWENCLFALENERHKDNIQSWPNKIRDRRRKHLFMKRRRDQVFRKVIIWDPAQWFIPWRHCHSKTITKHRFSAMVHANLKSRIVLASWTGCYRKTVSNFIPMFKGQLTFTDWLCA